MQSGLHSLGYKTTKDGRIVYDKKTSSPWRFIPIFKIFRLWFIGVNEGGDEAILRALNMIGVIRTQPFNGKTKFGLAQIDIRMRTKAEKEAWIKSWSILMNYIIVRLDKLKLALLKYLERDTLDWTPITEENDYGYDFEKIRRY